VRALRNEGIGILLTDHNVAETLRITDRTYVVLQGKVIAHGPPDEIVHNEQVIQVYLGRNFQGPSTSAA
jgi:lipopolysaccharide export system ATP-binding protein